MDIRKIKWIIAKEGLILLGAGVILYFILSAVPGVSCKFPKYKLVFQNGESYIVTISPEFSQHHDKKRLVREALDPPPQLVSRRINEFIRDNKIASEIKEARQINSREVGASRLLFSFFSLLFIVKVAFVYSIFCIIRFVAWALRTLREKALKK